jgi:hypothetical protein
MLAKGRMERRLVGKRLSSRLSGLIERVLSRPLVSSGMIQWALKVSRQGALNLIGELSLREMTGWGRFRAGVWCECTRVLRENQYGRRRDAGGTEVFLQDELRHSSNQLHQMVKPNCLKTLTLRT